MVEVKKKVVMMNKRRAFVRDPPPTTRVFAFACSRERKKKVMMTRTERMSIQFFFVQKLKETRPGFVSLTFQQQHHHLPSSVDVHCLLLYDVHTVCTSFRDV